MTDFCDLCGAVLTEGGSWAYEVLVVCDDCFDESCAGLQAGLASKGIRRQGATPENGVHGLLRRSRAISEPGKLKFNW